MEPEVFVMTRALKHGLTEAQVVQAWQNHIGRVLRIDRSDGGIDYKTIGFSKEGRAVEVTAGQALRLPDLSRQHSSDGEGPARARVGNEVKDDAERQ